MEYIMSGKQCLKIDLDQLNKWKCRQLCPKAWLWKEGKGELQRGSGVAVEHVYTEERQYLRRRTLTERWNLGTGK